MFSHIIFIRYDLYFNNISYNTINQFFIFEIKKFESFNETLEKNYENWNNIDPDNRE